MSVQSSGFDSAAYKESTRQQWQQAAEAWDRWNPALDEWLRPVTEAMIELAGIREGQQVLDVAAGAGEPAVTIAKRVGPSGSVLAIDNSSAILEFADRHARKEGVSNVRTSVMDGESLDLPDASFDAAVSRLGLIYFPDRIGALRQIHRVIREGSRVAIVGITNPADNPFSAITVSTLAMRAQLPPPKPGGPGPFSLGSEAVMREALERAGFVDLNIRIVGAPLHLASAQECAQFQREAFAGLDQMLGALSANEREAVWQEVAEKLRSFEHDGYFQGPAMFIVGSGARS